MSAAGWLVYVLRDLGHRHKQTRNCLPGRVFTADEWLAMYQTRGPGK